MIPVPQRYTKQPAKTMHAQMTAMQKYWTAFTCSASPKPLFEYSPGDDRLMRQEAPDRVTWTGTLQPREDAAVYQIEIVYQFGEMPRVYVRHPAIASDAPYRYKDGALGLYYPLDESWTPRHLISHTIVPWIALWLYFYEIWQITGTWGFR